MAEIMLADKVSRAGLAERVVIDSAGTSDEEEGRPAYPGTQRMPRRHGLDPVGHRARVFEPDWITGYDLVLAMDSGHARVVCRYVSPYGGDAGRVLLVGDLSPEPSGDVPDPGGTTTRCSRRSTSGWTQRWTQSSPPCQRCSHRPPDAWETVRDRR